MKHLALVLLFITSLGLKNFAQEASVEKSIWGVQMGIQPLSFYNESKLSNQFALRSELGFGFGWSGTSWVNSTTLWAIFPRIIVEPRYYYNLKRRTESGKRINGNSGNYISVNIGYVAENLSKESKNTVVYPALNIIPMYGLRRNIGSNFNCEFALGAGYKFNWEYYKGTKMPYDPEHGVTYGIRLVIGYKF